MHVRDDHIPPMGAQPLAQDILGQLSVLLVEDDRIVQISVMSMFSSLVRQVHLAATGEQGLDAYYLHRPDLIITDIRTPGMSGLEMIERIRRDNREVPIIVSTSYDDPSYLLKAIDLGVDKYVVKPANREQLLSSMARCGELIYQRRIAEEGNKLTRFLLDLQPNFMITVLRGKVEYLNATLLRHLGFASLNDFLAYGRPMGQYLVPAEAYGGEQQYSPEDWLHYILERPSGHVMLRLMTADEAQTPYAPGGRIVLATHSSFKQSDRHVLCLTDVTTLEKERRNLEGQARTDPLTGLLNRRTLLDILTEELQRCERYKTPLNCILFDIDDFKTINDRFGHHVGDDVLVAISRLVGENIRKLDRLARWGGEEFVILVPGCSCRDAGLLADKLRLLISEYDFNEAGRVTCSFGITDRRFGENAERLLRRADEAMYMAKRRGKNAIVVC